MTDPEVSVVIPTRDRPALVVGAVRSALAQVGVGVEVCVVDDGSSSPLVLPFDLEQDERTVVLRQDTPRGSAAARNVGIAATSAPLVAFLDDDDVFLPGKLARQLARLTAAGPDVLVVACGFEVWDDEALVATSVPPSPVTAAELAGRPTVWPSTVVVRRAALVAVGGFDESLARVEDWDLWLRLAAFGPFAVVPEVLVDRRWNALAPDVARSARVRLTPRLREAGARLPPRVAARARARRLSDDGVVLARCGRRREAALLLLGAWRLDPAGRAPLLALARVAAGERGWAALRRLAAPVRARRALSCRPPRPPGPAPGWAGP